MGLVSGAGRAGMAQATLFLRGREVPRLFRRMKRCIYHVGPWRRAMPWLVFGPMLVLAAGLWVFADSVENRSAGALVFAILTLMVLGLHALISYARLELTAEGVRLRQIGMNLAAPWTDVAGLRLDPGHEGFVTRRPIGGSGAANLEAVRGLGWYFIPIYNKEQQAVMAERRWIPIEAFAWHLRRGRLREDLALLAPAVQSLPPQLAPPANPVNPAVQRRRLVILLCALGAFLAAIVMLGLGPPSRKEHVFSVVMALLAPLLTYCAGWKAWNAFRSGARLMGVLFTFLTLLGVVWCLLVWGDLAILFSGAG